MNLPNRYGIKIFALGFMVGVLVSVLTILAAVTHGQNKPFTGGGKQAGSETIVPAQDLSVLWAHTYHPARLQILQAKATATGTLIHCRPEPDADLHCLVKLDPGQESLLNQVNIEKQHGYLVVEPICQRAPTQEDAKAACKGFRQQITIPPLGSHVRLTGSHVLDTAHGHLEFHSVSSVEVVP